MTALPLRGLQAVVVDLDGTMVDTLGDFAAALNLMLAELALPAIAPERIATMVGKGSEHLVLSALACVCPDPGPDAALCAAAQACYQRHYATVNGRYAQIYPGVTEGLQRLQRRGLALACLTNKPTEFAQVLLREKGLDGFFQHVFGGDAFERKKPDPLPLQMTCRALQSLPSDTLMLGDSRNDAEAARAAGCPVILVSYGYNHGQPVREVDADGFVDSLLELDALVQ